MTAISSTTTGPPGDALSSCRARQISLRSPLRAHQLKEAEGDAIGAGEELIDVGLYFGDEGACRSATRPLCPAKALDAPHTYEAWTASGLEKTIKGFARRYAELIGRFPADDVERRFRFEFTTNRPIDSKVKEAIADIASATASQHQDLHRTLIDFTGLDEV